MWLFQFFWRVGGGKNNTEGVFKCSGRIASNEGKVEPKSKTIIMSMWSMPPCYLNSIQGRGGAAFQMHEGDEILPQLITDQQEIIINYMYLGRLNLHDQSTSTFHIKTSISSKHCFPIDHSSFSKLTLRTCIDF